MWCVVPTRAGTIDVYNEIGECVLSGARREIIQQSTTTQEEKTMSNENTNENINPGAPVAWPDRASICHPAASGKGSAVRFELHPAHGRVSGYIMLEIARQKSVASVQGEVPCFATFDWENKICCKLCLGDLAQMVMVFRGMQESIQDGKGLFHRTAKMNAVIKFSHMIEPRPGYMLAITASDIGGDNRRDAYFIFRPEEAVWFSLALEGAMSVLVVGVPGASAYMSDEW